MAALQRRSGAYGVIPLDLVSRSEGDRPGGEPLFASEPLTGVSRRCAPLPTSEEVAPVVVAYLRQQGDSIIPRAIEALLPAEQAAAPAPMTARARETVILVALAVLLFAAAFAVAFAFLPSALD